MEGWRPLQKKLKLFRNLAKESVKEDSVIGEWKNLSHAATLNEFDKRYKDLSEQNYFILSHFINRYARPLFS